MRRLVLVLIAGSFALASLAAPQPSDEREILALEDDWAHALENEDRVALEAILATEFTFIEPDGTPITRNAYLADRANNPAEIHSFELSEMSVKVFDRAALVTGLSTIDESIAGKRYKYQLRWKEMWIKSERSWRVLAGQATPVNVAWNAPFSQPSI